jgi:hypothetical protein
MKATPLKATRCLIALIVWSLTLSACIAVPRFVDEPYSDLSYLKTGSTTKNDVISLMGEPGTTFLKESEFVYTEFQAKSSVGLPGLGGRIEWYDEGDQHFLQLTFDEHDTLSDFRVESGFRNPNGCIPSGWCTSWNWAFRLADLPEDIQAKQFTAVEGQCRIYWYSHSNLLPMTLNLDGKEMGQVFFREEFFQTWKIDPGLHAMIFSMPPDWKWIGVNPDNQKLTESFDCQKGEVLIMEYRRGFFSKAPIQIHDNAEGRDEVSKRRLILTGSLRKTADSSNE